MSNADDEEDVSLSSGALSALKEFYSERDAREKQFEDLKAVSEQNAAARVKLSMAAFQEDWNESQFWYSDETAIALAEELLRDAGSETAIAVVSAPSVFVQLKNMLNESEKSDEEKPKLYLLEYDRRFEVFSEFVFYDFNKPFVLPPSMKGTVNRFIVDPPFLSEDCQTKAAMTVRWLSKSWEASSSPRAVVSRLIVCTGERMESLINKLYRTPGISTTTFEPKHSKGLSNEFLCYANFECKRWNRKQASDGSGF